MNSFNIHLNEKIASTKSHLCVGLDISPNNLNKVDSDIHDLKKHTFKVIDSTRDLVVAYKPNLAFYERWGSKGFEWLEETLDYIGEDIITIGDAKRGDIGNTADQYAKSVFGHFGFDAVTLSPYMGKDSILPFIQNAEKGAFILCKTSNPSSVDIQNLNSGDTKVFETVAKLSRDWNQNNNIGLVVGATAINEIGLIRKYAKDMPFLIPGIGAQGGDLKESMRQGNINGSAIINISRGICFAGNQNEKDIRMKAVEYCKKMRESLNA